MSLDSFIPFTNTTGKPSFPCPINNEAADAISSAIPTSVTSNVLPNKSVSPLKSDNTLAPLEPIAIPTIPFRHALPELSLIMTPIFISVCFSTVSYTHLTLPTNREV